jgi:hypothetical protein
MSDAVMVPREPTEAMIEAATGCMDPIICTERWDDPSIDVREIYRDMVAAAPALAASTPVGGWEDISTAPKDGTLIMIGAPGCGVSLVRWLGGAWIDEQGFTQGSWPTHWQPAPPPPSVSIDNGSRPQEAVPTEQAAPPVLALLDQISALCTAFNDQIHDAEDTLGQINQLAYAGIAALRPDTVRKGIGDLAVIDLQTIRMWLEGLADCTDMNEVCADGGVTVGMAYQQDAREFSARIARMLPATPQPADGCSSNEGAGK